MEFANDFQHFYQAGDGPQTVLALHGTGGSERDLLGLALELWPASNVLGVRGRISERGAARFFRRNSAGVFDVENLRAEANALADFVGWASGEYRFDARNLWALGCSNGANIAASLFFLRPATLAGAVLLRAMTPLQDDLPDLTGKRIYLAAGEYDSLVPTQEIQDLEHRFKAAGAQVTLAMAPADHAFTRPEIEAIGRWLASLAPVRG